MSDQLGGLIETIVQQDEEDGYQDDELLVLLLLKKLLSQDASSFGAQEKLREESQESLIKV